MMEKVRLQVMICTAGVSGFSRVASMQMPRVPGVSYLVSCQSERIPLPPSLLREDVEVHFSSTTGLSNNRNNALSLVAAPYALVADDDLVFYAEGLEAVLEAFESSPSTDIACFRFEFPYTRVYPPGECDISTPYPNHHAVSFEIGVRMDTVRRLSLGFSPLLGIGAPYLSCGEEDMFVFNARRRGASVRFFPIVPGKHPDIPTLHRGVRAPGAMRAAGAVAFLQFPYTALLRFPLLARRLAGGWFRNMRLLMQGAWYALNHKKELK